MVLRRLLELTGIYKVYESWLKRQIDSGKVPSHVGLILDGNRRWAIKKNLSPWFGHRVGAGKVWDLIDWCKELNVKTLTIYAFSLDNFKRPKKEVDEIFRIFREEIRKIKTSWGGRDVRVKFIGRKKLLPEDLRRYMSEIEKETENNRSLTVNIAVAYGGKSEIVDAAREIARRVRSGEISPDDIDEETFQRHLYTSHLKKPDVDLIVRTSGEKRLSGFLLWQSAYSEFVFLDVYWPDFRKIDFMRAIRTFQRRNRRFGK